MNWVKGFALATCLVAPLSAINAATVSAEPMGVSILAHRGTEVGISKVAMSDAEKMAKAADCSKQADAKKLHGEARRKFRGECKKK